MKTNRDLSEMFEKARSEAKKVPVSEVKSLVESGKISPLAAKSSFGPRRITRLFNPLKFLIMITPLIIIATAMLVFNPGTVSSTKDLERQETEDFKTEDNKTIDLKTEDFKTGDKKTIDLKTEDIKTGLSLGVPVLKARQAVNPIVRDTQLKGVILDLTKEELTRLGFMFDEDGYYYLNKLPDGTRMNCWSWHTVKDKTSTVPLGILGNADIKSGGGSVGWGSGSWVNKENKSPLNNFDFYPVITTDLNGEDISPIEQVADQAKKSFELMNDTLVPVLFSRRKLGGYDTEDKLVWFKVSDQFFDLLKTEQSEKARSVYVGAKALNITDLNRNHVSYFLPLVLPLENAIRLKPDVLKCMGINYSPTAIDYKVRALDLWFDIQLIIKDGNTSMSARSTDARPFNKIADTLLPTVESIILLGVSNFGNMKIIDMPTRVYRQFNRKDLNFQDYLSLCVPVLVDEEPYSVSGKDVVFWIYPNERFFNCIPPEIAEPMKREFNYQKKRQDPNFAPLLGGSIGIKGGGLARDTVRMGGSIGIGGGDLKKKAEAENVEPVPCVYFTNLCESLPGLDYVNLYPNPATDKLNVDLVLQKAKNIRFRVFDMGGRVLSDEGKPQIYSEGGQFKHTVDVSKLQNGLYLLILTDDEGAKVTRRFVKN
jgi:hypothetical protein